MREEEEAATAAEEPNWFSRWEEELPTPEELMPLSQTLITPHLALAFDIPTSTDPSNPNPNLNNSVPSSVVANHHQHHHHHHMLAHPPPPPPPSSNDFESADLGSSGANTSGGGDEPARTLKRPRLVWTPQLHKRFVDAVAHLGIKNAVPKTIMQLMSVDGLTRENVASHLQKYRLYLKRMQGLGGAAGGAGGGAGGGSGGPISAADDQLFANGPIPHHFLTRGGAGGGDPYGPFVPMAAIQHHQQQMAVAAAAAAAAAQQQFYHQRQIGHFGSTAGIAGNGIAVGVGGGGRSFDHGFLSRGLPPPQHGLHRIVPPVLPPGHTAGSYVDDLEERNGGGNGGGRRVLTLFPTGED